MRFLIFLYQWTLRRLPKRFSIPMLVAAVLYYLFLLPFLIYHFIPLLTMSIREYAHIPVNWSILGIHAGKSLVLDMISATVSIGFALTGVVLSYGFASLVYAGLGTRQMTKMKMREPTVRVVDSNTELSHTLGRYNRIGIILSGGGAKGAYQAGAMTAIYEFLEKHVALNKVRMIAGTSIGSWNALFWLCGLIGGTDEIPGVLEQWWHQVDLESVIRPTFYVPFRQNYVLSNEPWKAAFDSLFVNTPAIHEQLLRQIKHAGERERHDDCEDCTHFYFTRSNVARAHLEFTTNRNDLSTIAADLPGKSRPRPPVNVGTWNIAKSVDDIRTAVFSSMDLPPLFQYTAINDGYFEDGGVVDNLPIRFGTEIEKCDLLFILPLNASFERAVNLRSITSRLFRVMDVRQGVLERNSFKMIYLFNELAGLREQVHRYKHMLAHLCSEIDLLKKAGMLPDRLNRAVETLIPPEERDLPNRHQAEATFIDATGERGLHRRHNVVQVFSICPAPVLAINTAEFWKTREAGAAFRLMYKATQAELEKFDFGAAPNLIRMARVSSQGEVTYFEDF
jgi:predicted acylesterase/phospholipase RssA